MSTLNIKLYDVLRHEFDITEERAKKITFAIHDVIKEDVGIITTEYKSIFKEDFKELEKEISKSEGRIELRIEQSKSDILKWFVSLFVTLFVALALMIFSIYLKK